MRRLRTPSQRNDEPGAVHGPVEVLVVFKPSSATELEPLNQACHLACVTLAVMERVHRVSCTTLTPDERRCLAGRPEVAAVEDNALMQPARGR